ncbi:MAG: hypothetical protein KGL67_01755 [Patescibacteria group bacterium]|nr:hypothetical protein [Patescibacteria group bacterium]
MIKKFRESAFSSFVSSITIISLVMIMSGIWQVANAASLTSITDTMTSQTQNTFSKHTIKFTSTSAIASSGTIVLAFPAGYTTTGLVIGDLSICHGTSTGLEVGAGAACTSNTETIAATNGANTVWGATITGTTTITFTAPTTWAAPVSAGFKVTVIINDNSHFKNPNSVTTLNTTITTTSDSGSFTVPIADSTLVGVTANVTQTISFDLDTSIAGGTSGAPYSVALGTLTSGAVNHSDASTINMIVINGGTNAPGGISVTVQNANGANGLASTSTPADKIASATATMAAGTANYGICVDSSGSLTGFTAQGTYATATPCTTASSTNHVVGLTTTPAAIVATTAPVSGALAKVFVNAAIVASQPAHTDYSDTLTFLATGTF